MKIRSKDTNKIKVEIVLKPLKSSGLQTSPDLGKPISSLNRPHLMIFPQFEVKLLDDVTRFRRELREDVLKSDSG